MKYQFKRIATLVLAFITNIKDENIYTSGTISRQP